MQYFNCDPSLEKFFALFCAYSSSRSQTPGFCYVNAHRYICFVGNLSSSTGSWKNKFFFIRSPLGGSWHVRTEWSFHKPTLKRIGTLSWDEGFIENVLTDHWFDADKLLTEDVL
ncbi:hypothetical protein Salat_0509300 [Sesamum alatum]|uniref:Uncharacterized protein n=1 Tax=Sesamum alatum TaxID=300844 RepID=A0AAE1Z4N3_9LAMI|nr:hypothetical protein Salat_0509300 [Sesamum alatum]